MTKQEKIQEAYGEQWKIVKDYADENGWIDFGIFGRDKYTRASLASVADIHRLCGGFENMQSKSLDVHPWTSYHRPKSLEGIETNNGWIKIESELDLPNDIDGHFHSGWFQNGKLTNYGIRSYLNLKHQYLRFNSINIYQKIIKPELPIY